MNADQFYLVGVQFEGVGEDSLAGLNDVLSLTDVTPVLFDDSSTDAARIDILRANGLAYDSFYYIMDADDGTERYDLTGWADKDGFLVDTSTLSLGDGFWIHVPSTSAGTSAGVTIAGQVSNTDEITVQVPADGTFAIRANPYPTSVNLGDVSTSGLTAVLFDDSSTDAARIDVLRANGLAYDSFYYISDADDGTERYDLTGWADKDGFIVDESVIDAGASFWIHSPSAGTLTFSL